MNDKNNGLIELIVMILFCIFLWDCVFHNYEDTRVHIFLQQHGISQKIESLEYKIKN